MAIPYVKQTWTDGAGGGTPVSGARLGVIEQGVEDAHKMPCCRATHNAASVLTTGVALALPFAGTDRFDTDTIHDPVTNNTRLTCKSAGVYQITGQVEFAANATGRRELSIKLNGATVIAEILIPAPAAGVAEVMITTLWKMAVNDYVELFAFQDSGGNLSLSAPSGAAAEFMMARVATG